VLRRRMAGFIHGRWRARVFGEVFGDSGIEKRREGSERLTWNLGLWARMDRSTEGCVGAAMISGASTSTRK
jgi:hypothetical protein